MTQRRYKDDIYMYRKVSLSSFHNGKVEYCAILGSGDSEENASVIFFTQDFSYRFLLALVPMFVEDRYAITNSFN